MASSGAAGIPGPPYPPQTQALGATPSVIPDVPINAVFLFLFFFGGVAHMTILQINEHKHHRKFALNGATFGFCVTRVAATSLRIAWACHSTSIPLGLSSTIFFYAGVVLLFIANLFFAQRIVRAQHPNIGWKWPFTIAVPLLIFVTIATIIALIVAIVIQFYTLNPTTRQATRDVQLYGATFYACLAFLPVPVVIISTLARLHPHVRRTRAMDKFGEGSMRAKVVISLVSGVLLTLGAAFRAGTSWLPPVPILTNDTPPQPYPTPWYFSKAAFYTFDFMIEAIIVWLWVIVRIDRRFIVPNGSKRPYSYAGGFIFAGESGNEKNRIGAAGSYSERDLIGGSQSFLPSRRSSFGASARSLAHTHRVSWGGISRESIHAGLGEDGIEIEPYVAYGDEALDEDPQIDGVHQEMGWDPKNGKWALRPISTSAMRYEYLKGEPEK